MADRKIIELVVQAEDPGGYLYKVGQGNHERMVTRIEEHSARGEGDKWYYDIHFDDGKMVRDFCPLAVTFGPEE